MAGERPLNINLTAWTDAGFMESVAVTIDGQPAVLSGFTDLELVAAESLSSTEAAFVGSVTAALGMLAIEVNENVLKALLPPSHSMSELTYQYVLRGRPTGSYRVRLMYGLFKLRKGLPEAPV